ncbi:uncharacterized protein ARMOST_16704 [Armillaria ostoyae]|uniref:MYND-type domain-containing protein n=1 Tax=Armillaria ostoyae TaxID=47428 RepID=A0A284RWZ8_ARMOS|nr:uncharacterized protein ARMOST_16704 [Armillaria ostoyae]
MAYTTIKAAKDGSLPALERLVSIVEDDEDTFPQFLPVFRYRLRNTSVPNSWLDPGQPHQSIIVARSCLKAIALGFQIKHKTPLRPDLIPQISEVLPNVLSWFMYFMKFYLLDKADALPEFDSGEDELTFNMMRLVADLSEIPSFVQILGRFPNFMRVITEVWILTSANDLNVAQATGRAIQNMTFDTNEPWLDDFTQVLHTTSISVAFPCLGRLILQIHSREPDYYVLKRCMMTMFNFSANSPPVKRAFLAADGVRWTCQLLRRLSSRKLVLSMTMDDFETSKGIISLCASYLSGAFADQFTWVGEALQAHLLLSIMKCQPYFMLAGGGHTPDRTTGNTLNDVLVHLLNEVNCHSVIRAVLRQATRAIREVEWHPFSIEKGIEKDAPKLWEAWARLKKACPLPPEVTPEAMLPSLKKCVGCCYAYYCSTKCQKEAWKGGHREICTHITKNRKKGHPPHMNPRDGAFLLYLVKCDMKRNPNHIKTLKKEYRQSHPADNLPLVVVVNYLVVPRTFSVFSASVYKGKPDWDQHVADARAGEGQLVFISVPHGPNVSHELKLIHGI